MCNIILVFAISINIWVGARSAFTPKAARAHAATAANLPHSRRHSIERIVRPSQSHHCELESHFRFDSIASSECSSSFHRFAPPRRSIFKRASVDIAPGADAPFARFVALADPAIVSQSSRGSGEVSAGSAQHSFRLLKTLVIEFMSGISASILVAALLAAPLRCVDALLKVCMRQISCIHS